MINFKERLSKSGSVTISINPNKYNIEGEAIISNNPNNSELIFRIFRIKTGNLQNLRNTLKLGKATNGNNPRHTSKANDIN